MFLVILLVNSLLLFVHDISVQHLEYQLNLVGLGPTISCLESRSLIFKRNKM